MFVRFIFDIQFFDVVVNDIDFLILFFVQQFYREI